jgi:hypothetical protein
LHRSSLQEEAMPHRRLDYRAANFADETAVASLLRPMQDPGKLTAQLLQFRSGYFFNYDAGTHVAHYVICDGHTVQSFELAGVSREQAEVVRRHNDAIERMNFGTFRDGVVRALHWKISTPG